MDVTCDIELRVYGNTINAEFKFACIFYLNIIDFLLQIIQKALQRVAELSISFDAVRTAALDKYK